MQKTAGSVLLSAALNQRRKLTCAAVERNSAKPSVDPLAARLGVDVHLRRKSPKNNRRDFADLGAYRHLRDSLPTLTNVEQANDRPPCCSERRRSRQVFQKSQATARVKFGK
jgi:hypothetical protein